MMGGWWAEVSMFSASGFAGLDGGEDGVGVAGILGCFDGVLKCRRWGGQRV
jgi:hypothetical protein